MISAAHPARNDGATEECAEYARKSDSNVQLHTLSALRLSSVRAPGGARAPGAVHTSSYWARGTHGPRQSSRLNTHTVSSCTVSIPAVWTVAVSARHFIPYTAWGAAHKRPLRLEVRLQQQHCPSHSTTPTPTSHARVGPPSPKCCGCRGFPRPFQRECWAGGRAHSNPARWGATSWRSKATPITDRMRSRRYDTPRTFCSHPPTEYR